LETPPSSPASTISSRNRLVLRRADDIINRLADYHATARATHPQPRARLAKMPRSPANWNADATTPIARFSKTTLPRNLAGTRQLTETCVSKYTSFSMADS